MFSTKTVSRVYLTLALLAAMLLSPLSYLLAASALLLLQAYSIYRPLRAGLNLVLTFSTLFIMPLTLQDAAGELAAPLLVIPAIPLLDHSLKEYASIQNLRPSEGKKPTTLLTTLLTAIIVVLVISLILANWTLSLTCALMAAYLIAAAGYTLYGIPGDPLQSSYSRVRIIVDNTSKVSLMIKKRSRPTLHILFTSPYPWVSLHPERITIGSDAANLNLTITPPLSGPSKPQVNASMTDPRGLIRMNQTLEPVEMHVIPRAKYAKWLAEKFLTQKTPHFAPISMESLSSKEPVATRRGVEYLSSRPYQPGDMLKEMDWKRMSKFNRLVVKEYSEANELSTLIAVNLTVKDPEEADRLAYNLITLALTLAKADMPSALVAYNHREVLLTTRIEEARKILKRTLELEQDIVMVEPMHRFLQPPNIERLRRTRIQLEQAKTEPAQKLANLLRLENEAIQRRGKDHPAGRAITRAAEYVHPPATVAVLSGWNHDSEALPATLDRLKRHGYTIMHLEINRGIATPRSITRE
ncbi:DUF58 domain-containing protein [Chloroflexota bacterium]